MFKLFFLCAAYATLQTVWAQDAAKDISKPPSFIAADVHVTPSDSKSLAAGALRDGQYEVRGMTMLFILQRAYSIDADHIIGGPRRLDMDKYDIIAKVPDGTKAETVPPMLKALLAERFHLVAKEEMRPMLSYALTLGKGKHKLKPAEGHESQCNSSTSQNGGQMRMHLICKAYTTAQLANIMRSLGNGFIAVPVTDQTGLQASWDFEMDFVPGVFAGTSSLMSAVENQLGLKLEQKQIDQLVLGIESIDVVPMPNAPGVAAMMAPPAPTPTIEVATIKPIAAAAAGAGSGFRARAEGQNAMQLEGRGVRLSTLIQLGWGLTPDRVVGLSPSADDQQFDIAVRLSGQSYISTATVGPIFQGLLKERFQLEAHLEDRPVNAYKLVAVKPRMAKADPSGRAGCKDAPIPQVREAGTPARAFTCRNITMVEFAEQLQGMSLGAIRTPVVDATKLEGLFDFTLTYSLPTGATQTLTTPPPSTGGTAAAPLASDPSDEITIFEAVGSQLGLKLEPEKRPMPVLIIDRIEKNPTEN